MSSKLLWAIKLEVLVFGLLVLVFAFGFLFGLFGFVVDGLICFSY
jgi:preprotein translocase subunit SecE